MDIVCDRDPMFSSDIKMQVFKKLGTSFNMSSTNYPQSDGQIERVNQIIKDMLQVYVTKKPKE